jgi:predicted nuclease of predicted toxin-antitoxin system
LSGKKTAIPFFTDNDVPDAVGDLLRDSGHQVHRLREVMLTDSADPVVAATCREFGLVLITHNIKHFAAIVKQHQVSRGEMDRLCRIELGCVQPIAVERVAAALSVIEAEWDRLGPAKAGLRIFIGDSVIRLHR